MADKQQQQKSDPAPPSVTAASKVMTEEQKQKWQMERQATLKKLAAKRITKAIKSLELVGNLASYKPTPEQAAIIEAALVKAHNDCIGRLKGGMKAAVTFSL
jgi:hypothetical protein